MNTVPGVEFACSVSQLVSDASRSFFAIQRLQESIEITEGASWDIEDLATTLLEHTGRVKYSVSDATTLLSEEDEICLGLLEQCQRLSSQLSTRLQQLTTGDGLQDRPDSTAEALDNGDGLRQALDLIKNDLNERLATHLWRTISQTIRELGARNSRLGANRGAEIEGLASKVDVCFREIKSKDTGDDQKLSLWFQIRTATQSAVDYDAEQTVLGSLQFWTMDRRKELISKEHENTFGWILEQGPSQHPSQPTTTFAGWLSRNEPLYWISGKPGSGKSTLMKLIAESPKTSDGLKQWAGNDTIVTASFYFWSSAKDPLQKSDVGLLRSIIFQILRQCPGLIKHAFPEQWKDRESQGSMQQFARTELAISHLLAVYQRIAALISSTKVKFCFFIDGLDEYDGEPTDMVQLVLLLSKTENVKACISSRQWTEFEDVFGGENPWKLYIHHLTKGDMRLYVQDLLCNDERFSKMKEASGEDKVQSLVENIVENAEGVFLWVLLVVRSLIDGLTDTDEIVDLQQKLTAIPNDLDSYFEKIFLDIEPHMRVRTSQIFQITLNAVDKLPLMCYWFIQNGTLGGLENMEQESLAQETAKGRLEEISKWLNVHSQGLLKANDAIDGKDPSSNLEEHQWLFEFRVDFLHRTVADFLRTADMIRLLNDWSVSSFNVDFEICEACLATIKITPPTAAMFRDPPHAPSIIDLLMSHAKPLDGQVQADLLDEFIASLRRHDDVLGEIGAMILGPGNYWAYQSSFNFAILYHCVAYGLGQYVGLQLDRGEFQFAEPPSGLLSGCVSWDPRVRTGKFTLSVDTIESLLRRGLDPNLPWGDRGLSFWQQLLTTIYSRHLKGTATQADCDAITCAIDQGADSDASVEVFSARRLGHTSASDIVEKILPREQFLALRLARHKS